MPRSRRSASDSPRDAAGRRGSPGDAARRASAWQAPCRAAAWAGGGSTYILLTDPLNGSWFPIIPYAADSPLTLAGAGIDGRTFPPIAGTWTYATDHYRCLCPGSLP
ncbi:hypothetical protein BN13_420065 [Nostocoides jenkinsii Ben 74]|uniref:Uncharacterized protein n=1 Tax=Nostocoides jenkinsii Ben 74 TaxID=1193518 RepID=A0A077M8G1_9MICO|nr:hypothetical protein BN13_420065 [Tetrasphaera jenkinsii Ben 74]